MDNLEAQFHSEIKLGQDTLNKVACLQSVEWNSSMEH